MDDSCVSTDDSGDDRMAEAIRRAIPGATVTLASDQNICPACGGDGVIPVADGYADGYADCKECGGHGWAGYGSEVDDADHAEHADPIDHTYDGAISSATLTERLTAVLDLHRSTPDGTCAAELFRLYPCPTARAALGIK